MNLALCILLSLFIIVGVFNAVDDHKIKRRIFNINARLSRLGEEVSVPEIEIARIERLLNSMNDICEYEELKQRFYIVHNGDSVSVFVEKHSNQI